MTNTGRLLAATTFAGALSVSGALAQSYGNHEQVLTAGAAEFRPDAEPEGFTDAYGYVLGTVPGGSFFYAPLALPEGARIDMICLYAWTSAGTNSSELSVAAAKLVPGGGSPDLNTTDLKFGFAALNGYGTYCSDPLAYTLRSTMDVDGDGVLDSAVHYVRVGLSRSLALGGVRITWTRQVSPAPETPSFTDVPASDPAFPNIEALYSSGITAGCNDGTIYCPEATLTRRQMAVFLAKALGLHWTD